MSYYWSRAGTRQSFEPPRRGVGRARGHSAYRWSPHDGVALSSPKALRATPQPPSSPRQVARTIHKYGEIEAPATSLERAPTLPKNAFQLPQDSRDRFKDSCVCPVPGSRFVA